MNPLMIASVLGPTLLQGIMGQQQIGSPAPAPNLGGQGNGGLLGPVAAPPVQSGPAPLSDVLNFASQAATSGLGATPAETPEVPVDGQQQKPQGFGGFMGGIDKALQSPSHLLALGLLKQMGGNGFLPLAGLLGMGLLNRKK